jgi:exonuclease SbcD
MKILHTSDWHLGRSLYGRKRYEEFEAFLNWLIQTIEDQQVDALLIAGDIFDTSTPSNKAQELYYRFLYRVASSCCNHVVIICGNHDSPSFLDAPKQVLRALNVYVVGSMTEALEDEVFVLHTDDKPKAIICAVPYLRDKDIRISEAGETIDDKNAKLLEGLKDHYKGVCALAEQKREELQRAGNDAIPIIAMGHLFTAGGKTVDQDGVRELYVGSLAHVEVSAFPPVIDYLALGHLHVPQTIGKAEHIRYCGSPIPMGFGEATQKKQVVLVEFSDITPTIHEIAVPCFQQLIRIAGSLDEIYAKLEALKVEQSSAWLEIEYNSKEIIANLRQLLEEAISGSSMELLRIKNNTVMDRVISLVSEQETLDDLDEEDVFIRCLDAFEVPEEDRKELMVSYKEIVKTIHEEDVNET